MAQKRYWMGSIEGCELCEIGIGPTRSLTSYTTFVDGKTEYGPWAIMCDPCHKEHGCGLGMGKGQRYEWDGNGFAKVEG